jgi:hypothetical protein
VPYDWAVNVDQLNPEKQTKLHLNLRYGGDAAMDADTLGTEINASNKFQESWSEHRLPPPRGWYVASHLLIIVSGSCTSILDCIATLFIDLFSLIAIILRIISYTLTLSRLIFYSLSTGAIKKQRLTFAPDDGSGSCATNSNDPILSPVPQPLTHETFSTPKSSPSDDMLPLCLPQCFPLSLATEWCRR